jgi:hypothetical protein
VNSATELVLLATFLAQGTAVNAGGAAEPSREAHRGALLVIHERIAIEGGYPVAITFSRPSDAGSSRLPAVTIVGWLSCDPIDGTAPGPDTFNRLIYDVATETRNAVVFGVEKPGVDDSPGPPRSDNDFSTALAAYQAGLPSLAARTDADPSRIYLLGMSSGGGVAPLVAGKVSVAGYVVWGGWAKAWLEHTLELERRRMALADRTPAQVKDAMRISPTSTACT